MICPFCEEVTIPGIFYVCKNHDMMICFAADKPAFFSKDGLEIRIHNGLVELWSFHRPTAEDIKDMEEYNDCKYYHTDGFSYDNCHSDKCILSIKREMEVTPNNFEKCMQTLKGLVVFS